MRTPKSVLALALSAILFSACGGLGILGGFRVAVASSRPFIDSLVRSGAISQAKATSVIADLNDGIAAASQGEQCLTTVTGTGSAKKVAQAKCYFEVAQTLRVILERHNLGGDTRLTQIADIVSGAIAAFEEFFRNTTGSQNAAVAGPAIDHEKVLAGKMKALEARMKAVMSASVVPTWPSPNMVLVSDEGVAPPPNVCEELERCVSGQHIPANGCQCPTDKTLLTRLLGMNHPRASEIFHRPKP